MDSVAFLLVTRFLPAFLAALLIHLRNYYYVERLCILLYEYVFCKQNASSKKLSDAWYIVIRVLRTFDRNLIH